MKQMGSRSANMRGKQCEKDHEKYNLLDSCKQLTKCFRTVLKTSLRFFCGKKLVVYFIVKAFYINCSTFFQLYIEWRCV